MTTDLTVIYYTSLALVPIAAVVGALVLRWRSRLLKQREALGRLLAQWAFRQSDAPYVGRYHWVGTWASREVVIGLYQGRGAQTDVSLAEPALELIVHSGRYPGLEALVLLSKPPRWTTAVEPVLQGRLDALGVGALADLDYPTLFYARDLIPGVPRELAIRSHPQPVWDGVSMRATMPPESTAEEISTALDQMTKWLAAL
jgi:hypothetical protein